MGTETNNTDKALLSSSQPQQSQSSRPTKKSKRSQRQQQQPPPDIPLSAHYHISWMHASPITSVDVSLKHGYVISGDSMGIVKFWKRCAVSPDAAAAPMDALASSRNTATTGKPCLEFVKSYTAHTSSVRCIQVGSGGGDACVSVSLSKEERVCRLKFYDVATFDAVSMVQWKLDPQPESTNDDDTTDDTAFCSCVWFQTTVESQTYLAVAVGCTIRIVDPQQSSSSSSQIISLHAAPITALVTLPQHNCILSADRAGTLEVWDTHGRAVVVPDTATATPVNDDNDDGTPSVVVHVGGPITPRDHGITYRSKQGETDLYLLQRKRTWAVAATATAQYYALYTADHKIRVFQHVTGLCLVTFAEGIQAYGSSNNSYTNFGLDAMAFGKRSATETAMVGVFTDHTSQRLQLQFDPTGNYLLLPTMMGLKVLDWKQRKLTGVAGKLDADALRFVGCCLAPGDAVVDQQIALARGTASTSVARSEQDKATAKAVVSDTLLIGIAYQQRRLYVYSHVDPVLEDGPDAMGRRDVWNEAPTLTDQRFQTTGATSGHTAAHTQTTKAILRTTKGDIHIQLFGSQVPKTMENFVGHCQSGYYDTVLFHRVIAGFMLQTGDPLGDGTGGESIWGDDFQDEIVPGLRHDRPFTVSMANKGPHTNGSQFFITTAPTPWLDGKHTVFGRVVRGMDICTQIEKVKTDKNDKPLDEIRIQNIDLE